MLKNCTIMRAFVIIFFIRLQKLIGFQVFSTLLTWVCGVGGVLVWGGWVPGGVVVGFWGVAAATGQRLQGLLLGGHGSAGGRRKY